MKLETFFEKFDQLADAPDAVGKMRELILTLAVQGKIVHQDPNDEPAAELFARIETAREKLIKQRMIKRVAVEANPGGDECESLPAGWLWTRLGNSFDVRDGTHGTPKYTTEGFPLITSKNIYSGNLLFDGANLISEKDHRQISERSRVDQRDILFAMIGSIGNPVIVDTDREFSIKNLALFKYYTAADSVPRFLLMYLKLVAKEMKAKAAGGVQSFVSLGFLRSYRFPLPPLAEQKRIVAKVDELMALCDRLEVQQQERETRHAALARASLARFADAPTPANLNYLFHPSYSISPADLRKSILTLAVQGKLVPQDPNDEPVESTVGCSVELNAEPPFEIPEQWTWTHLSQLAEINGGFAFKSTAYTEDGIRVVRISDFDEFGFKNHKVVRHPFSSDLQKFTLAEQNILMAMTGGTVGKSYFVRSLPEPMVVNQRVATIKVSANAYPSYVDVAIRSEMTQDVIHKAKNSTNDNISMGDIKRFAIPLPPLAEQLRIVAKVEQLMALVDALETQLVTSRAAAANLLSALVAELTGIPEGRVASPAPTKPVAAPSRPKPQKANVASTTPAVQESKVSPSALADMRKAAGMTQTALAKAMSLNQAYISQMETGKRPITKEQRQEFAKIFGSLPNK